MTRPKYQTHTFTVRPSDSLAGYDPIDGTFSEWWCVDHFDGAGRWVATHPNLTRREAFALARRFRRRMGRS